MKKTVISIIISLAVLSLHAQKNDANPVGSSRDDVYRLQVTGIYVTDGIDKRPVTYLLKNSRGREVETPFTWQGTGFLLDDGRFVTSRHCIQPWRYTAKAEILRNVAFADSRTGYRIEATVKATSAGGRTFTFSASDFTVDDSRDEKQQLGAYDDGTSCWALSAITSKDPQAVSTDWAYIRTPFRGKLAADSTLSDNLMTNAELHILGFAGQTAVAATGRRTAVNPVYTRSQAAYDGLDESGCFPYVAADNVEYSGSPVIVIKDGRQVVVGITARSAAQGGGRKYAVPVSGMNVRNGNGISAIDAQDGMASVDSRRLVEEAVADGFFVMRQRYRLRNKTTNTYYGWNNEPYFGTVYSLAVRTVNGYYISDAVLHPWDYDARYDQYRNDKTFEPGNTATARRPATANTWTDQKIDAKACTAVPDMPLAWVKSADFDNKGFAPVDKSDGDSWVVWLTSARPSSAWGVSVADTLQLSCLIYSSKHRYDNGKTVCEIQAPAAGDRTLLGGVCLVPFATGTGQVEFRISGVLAQKDGKWYAVQPRQVDATVQPAGRDGKLTPVGGGGKRDGNTPSGRRVIPSPFSQ